MDGTPHPISLDRVFFTRSVVIAIPEHRPENTVLALSPTNKIDVVRLGEETGSYMATMRSTFNSDSDPASPYMIDMECVGIFAVDDTLTSEEAARGVTITAHSVLYGAIREAVSWITGRQPYGQLSLGLSVLRPADSPEQ